MSSLVRHFPSDLIWRTLIFGTSVDGYWTALDDYIAITKNICGW